MKGSSLFETRCHIILFQISIWLDLPSCQENFISIIPNWSIAILFHFLLLRLKANIRLIIARSRGGSKVIPILIIDVV